jgi:ElaA protein
MEYQVKHFSELTTKEFYEVVKLRTAAFVVEQHCPYQEVDAADENAWHTWLKEGTELIGYTRIMDFGTEVTFGRVLIKADYRKRNLGSKLVAETLQVIAEKYPQRPIKIGAQAHLIDFYGSFGFEPVSEVYLEDGIPHVDMLKQV